MKTASANNVMTLVDAFSRDYDTDPDHNRQVTLLALALFDGLRSMHGYGSKERRLLEIAGRLHDIGWSKTVLKKHHIISGKMILEMELPGLSKKDQLICALIARYHTKALPDVSKHALFAGLSAENQSLVEWLAGILRIADALDSSHTGVVNRLWLEIANGTINIHLKTSGDCWDEIRRAHSKEDLLKIKSGKSIIYQ